MIPFARIPGPFWFRLLAHALIFAVLVYGILKLMQVWMAWHFEHPIQPK